MKHVVVPDTVTAARRIVHRTRGQKQGPITRLASPGDLGDLMKPFVFLDVFEADSPKAGMLGYHPHSGIATVTVIFEGDTAYEDSTGQSGVLDAGGVEWMQAGGGVWHTAGPAAAGRVRGYQLWLALPPDLENGPAESRYLPPSAAPVIGPARVILGAYGGVVSPLPRVAALTYLHVHLADGQEWNFDPPVGHDVAWLAVDQGVLEIAGEDLSNELAVFEGGCASFAVRARGEANFVLGSATRHPHALVTGYYSVHTSPEALRLGEAGIQTVGRRLRAEGRL